MCRGASSKCLTSFLYTWYYFRNILVRCATNNTQHDPSLLCVLKAALYCVVQYCTAVHTTAVSFGHNIAVNRIQKHTCTSHTRHISEAKKKQKDRKPHTVLLMHCCRTVLCKCCSLKHLHPSYPATDMSRACPQRLQR